MGLRSDASMPSPSVASCRFGLSGTARAWLSLPSVRPRPSLPFGDFQGDVGERGSSAQFGPIRRRQVEPERHFVAVAEVSGDIETPSGARRRQVAEPCSVQPHLAPVPRTFNDQFDRRSRTEPGGTGEPSAEANLVVPFGSRQDCAGDRPQHGPGSRSIARRLAGRRRNASRRRRDRRALPRAAEPNHVRIFPLARHVRVTRISTRSLPGSSCQDSASARNQWYSSVWTDPVHACGHPGSRRRRRSGSFRIRYQASDR